MYFRWLAKIRLTRRYNYTLAVHQLMEEYTTQRILAGGSAETLTKSRNELLQKQAEIKETEKFLLFLKKSKLKQ